LPKNKLFWTKREKKVVFVSTEKRNNGVSNFSLRLGDGVVKLLTAVIHFVAIELAHLCLTSYMGLHCKSAELTLPSNIIE
jgi:hypothetical protein